MQTIITSFNKTQVNYCADRCITTLQHKSFTPDQQNCFKRCTRNINKFGIGVQRFRSDSQEIDLKINSL